MTRSMKHAVKQQFRTSLRSQGEERLSYQRTEHYLMPMQYHKSWLRLFGIQVFIWVVIVPGGCDLGTIPNIDWLLDTLLDSTTFGSPPW